MGASLVYSSARTVSSAGPLKRRPPPTEIRDGECEYTLDLVTGSEVEIGELRLSRTIRVRRADTERAATT